MSKLAVVTPIVLQNERMLNIYLANLATYNPPAETTVYVILNRNIFSVETLKDLFKKANPKLEYVLVFDVERSVAGAWNEGILRAKADGIDIYHILAADIALHPDAPKIVFHKMETGDYDLVSTIDYRSSYGNSGMIVNIADFSSVFLTSKTIEKFGYFDREYKPAYFEDNDYTARMIVSDSLFFGCNDAIHYHYGSATIKVDAEMAHHVNHWFNRNRDRFVSKWGTNINNDIDYMRKNLYRSPMNLDKPVTWWAEQDKPGYSVSGAIHD